MFKIIIPPTVDISPNGGNYNVQKYQEFLTYKDKEKLDSEWTFSATEINSTCTTYTNPYNLFDEAKINLQVSYNYTGAIFSNKKVDVTNMNTLVLKCHMYDNASSNSYINQTTFGLSNDNTTINGNWVKNSTEEYVASTYTGHATGTPKAAYKEFKIDVSSLTGEYYIQLAVKHVSPDAYTAITFIEDMYATYSQYLPTTISTTLTATDGEGSGLNKLEYAWSTSDTKEPTSWKTFTNGQTVTREVTGEKLYLWTNVTDNNGNRATNIKTSKAFTPNEIEKDTIAPSSVTVTYNGGANTCSWKNDYNITLSASDNIGIEYYEIDWTGDYIADGSIGSNFIPWNNYYSCNTRFRAVDYAGNRGPWSEAHHIHMDTEAPGPVTVTYNGGSNTDSWKNNYNMTLSASDNIGIAYYEADWYGNRYCRLYRR